MLAARTPWEKGQLPITYQEELRLGGDNTNPRQKTMDSQEKATEKKQCLMVQASIYDNIFRSA